MKRFLLSFLVLLVGIACRSQTASLPDMSPDRPGMANPPDIVMARKFQIESGSSFERVGQGSQKQYNILYNTSLLRVGFNKKAELRIQCDFAQLRTDSINIAGINPVTLGTKLLLTNGYGFIPKTSVLMSVTLPWIGKKDFRPAGLLPSFYLLMQNNITDKLNICYNVGAQYDEESTSPVEFLAICVSYNFTDKFGSFVENYDYFAAGLKPVTSIDFGSTYMVTSNVQLDMSANLNLNDFRHYFMISGGVAWRMVKKPKTKTKI